jgi:nitric oxide reductase subunit B
MKKLWISFAAVVVVSFLVLGWIGTRIYEERPPIPARIVDTGGTVVVADGAIGTGKTSGSLSAVWK